MCFVLIMPDAIGGSGLFPANIQQNNGNTAIPDLHFSIIVCLFDRFGVTACHFFKIISLFNMKQTLLVRNICYLCNLF